MNGVVNIDIAARSRIWSFDFLVYWSFVTTIEGSMHNFLHQYLVLNVILFLLMIILTRAWIFGECLPGVGCFTLMFPEFTSLRLRQKGLWLLSDVLAIGVLLDLVIGSLFD